jgi:hypothetical protein
VFEIGNERYRIEEVIDQPEFVGFGATVRCADQLLPGDQALASARTVFAFGSVQHARRQHDVRLDRVDTDNARAQQRQQQQAPADNQTGSTCGQG